ncbi:holin [Aeromonas phage phiARM81ld]|nr:holin [Aeromonas phage phiARM81ld]
MKMPTKDPGLLALIAGLVVSHWEQISFFFLTIFIAINRIYSSGNWVKKSLSEALLCGLLWWPFSALLVAVGVPENIAGSLACSVGLFGSNAVLEFGKRFLANKGV